MHTKYRFVLFLCNVRSKSLHNRCIIELIHVCGIYVKLTWILLQAEVYTGCVEAYLQRALNGYNVSVVAFGVVCGKINNT